MRARGEGIEHVTCRLCGRDFKAISYSHLVRIHDYDPDHPIAEYQAQFGRRSSICRDSRRALSRGVQAWLGRSGKKWTADRIVRGIRALRRAGVPLHSESVTARCRMLILKGRELFGTWGAALEAAGFRSERHRIGRVWTREKILDTIRAWDARGRKLDTPSVKRRDEPFLQAAVLRFGSWRATLIAAGVDPDRFLTRSWTPDRVIAEVRKRGPVREVTLRRGCGGFLSAARRLFGTWPRAVEAAGLTYPPDHRLRWTKPVILRRIRDMARGNARLRSKNFDTGFARACDREFGGWREAIRASGVRWTPWVAIRWSREEILRRIRERRRRGLGLAAGAVGREDSKLYDAARRYFGGWARAIAAAFPRA